MKQQGNNMDTTKLNEFARQLFTNPALKGLGPVEIEDSVMAIISNKEQKLQSTFTSPEYYPDMSWENIKAELLKIIGDVMASLLKPKLQELLFTHIHILYLFPQPDNTSREKIIDFILKMSARPSSRKIYGKILSFINSDILKKFTSSIYEHNRQINHGFSRTDSLPMQTPEECLDFLYTCFLFLPCYDISLPEKAFMPPQFGSVSNKSMTLNDLKNNTIFCKNFMQKIQDIITKEVPDINSYLLQAISKAFFSEGSEEIPIHARLLKVLYHLVLDWKTGKKEKGAESFTLSWLNIARADAKFYGYDYDIVDELYKISIEEGL
jgi:hypothetical protein